MAGFSFCDIVCCGKACSCLWRYTGYEELLVSCNARMLPSICALIAPFKPIFLVLIQCIEHLAVALQAHKNGLWEGIWRRTFGEPEDDEEWLYEDDEDDALASDTKNRAGAVTVTRT